MDTIQPGFWIDLATLIYQIIKERLETNYNIALLIIHLYQGQYGIWAR